MGSWSSGRDGVAIAVVFHPQYVTFKVESFSREGDRMRGHAQAWADLTSPAEAKDLAEKLWGWAQAREEEN